MRSIKIIAGLTFVILALFVIFREQTAGVSADAFVNARISTIRAPIAGTFELVSRPLGARISRGDTLGALSDPLVDNIRLSDLLQERAETLAEIDRLSRTGSAIQSAIEELRAQAASHRKERTEQLRALVESAEASRSAAEARLRYAELSLERSRRLSKQGIRTGESLEEAQSSAEVAALNLRNAEESSRVARINLGAAERGILLGDGYNDTPSSGQRISELQARMAEIDANAEAQSAIFNALEARIRTERLRVNLLTSSALEANVSGLVWDYLALSGEAVQRGQDLLRLVDCDSAIVTLSVTERVYNGIELGSSASFRMNGSGRLLQGTVTRVAGSAAAAVYDNLAIAPSERHLGRFDVTLDVPALREDPQLRCLVGRTGRVFLESRPLDWLRRLWS
ncbi:MAG: HlyD family efflux transporter periplasmic adaptor subunit [Arenimonas sp.]|nr:HlyD family efflux transporter periplasmic adaptor subunit [Rhizobium sp.]MBW8445438.1 HlyD family efflux transporter periplasmic adaptor subunit [Arenimonas sp.]